MSRPHYKITNLKHYNQALINRGSLVFWIAEGAIQHWKQFKQGTSGRARFLVIRHYDCSW